MCFHYPFIRSRHFPQDCCQKPGDLVKNGEPSRRLVASSHFFSRDSHAGNHTHNSSKMKRVQIKNEGMLLRPDGGHPQKKSKLDSNDDDGHKPNQVVSNGKLEQDSDDKWKMMSTNREHRSEATQTTTSFLQDQQQRQQVMKNQLWQIHSAIQVQRLQLAQLQRQLLRLLQQEYFNFLAMTSQSYADEELRPILQFTLLAHENLTMQAELLMLSIAGIEPIVTLYPVVYVSQAPHPTGSTARSEFPESVTSMRCRHET